MHICNICIVYMHIFLADMSRCQDVSAFVVHGHQVSNLSNEPLVHSLTMTIML